MKNLEGKFIKIRTCLFVTIYFVCIALTYGQKRDLLVYTNSNYWSVFIFDFNNNRYCYTFAKDAFVGCPIYSRGNIIIKGDTTIIKSDYDNRDLPFNIECSTKTDLQGNNILFKIVRHDNLSINDRAYENERNRLLYFIINDVDTIRLDKDIINYLKEIKKFCIVSCNEGYTYYRTKDYYNLNNCNNFNITFNLNLNYAFYKTLNDTIIINKSKAIWYLSNDQARVNLKKTSFNKVKRIYDYCECWDKDGVINLEVDTPEGTRRTVKDKR